MVTKRDFEYIAEIIRDNTKGNPDGPILVKNSVVRELCSYFLQENNLFKVEKFKSACSRNYPKIRFHGDR